MCAGKVYPVGAGCCEACIQEERRIVSLKEARKEPFYQQDRQSKSRLRLFEVVGSLTES